MICPHCCSPRHNLCAPGFKLEVDMTTLADALEDFSASALQARHSHLLGHNQPAGENCEGKRILVVLPVFSDRLLGDYGTTILADRAPELLHGRSVNIPAFQGAYGQVHLIDFSAQPEKGGINVDLLLVGQGAHDECSKMHFCGLVGTAIDTGIGRHYDQIVTAIADFTTTAVDGGLLAAVARCRLAVCIVEDNADTVIRRLTLIVHDSQVSGICHGIDVAGPLCSGCGHPHAGWLSRPRR